MRREIGHMFMKKHLFIVLILCLFILIPVAVSDAVVDIDIITLRHRVRDGETLWFIAVLYGTTVREILLQNNLLSDVIVLGQELVVTSGERDMVASWYGKWFNGKPTASGIIFSSRDTLVAHKKLPLGSWVEITNPDTGVRVKVQVLDRGPYIRGREFDLSERTAEILGMKAEGVKRLKVRILSLPDQSS